MERDRKRNIDVREKHQPVAFCTRPDWGSNPQPTYLPWPESNLQPFSVRDNTATEQPGQGREYLFLNESFGYFDVGLVKKCLIFQGTMSLMSNVLKGNTF